MRYREESCFQRWFMASSSVPPEPHALKGPNLSFGLTVDANQSPSLEFIHRGVTLFERNPGVRRQPEPRSYRILRRASPHFFHVGARSGIFYLKLRHSSGIYRIENQPGGLTAFTAKRHKGFYSHSPRRTPDPLLTPRTQGSLRSLRSTTCGIHLRRTPDPTAPASCSSS